MSTCDTSNAVWKNMNQQGVAGVTVAILSGVIVMMAAFAIDVGHALVTRNQLQNAADAAALSAGRQLGLTYLALPPGDQQNMSRNLTSQEQSQVITSGENASYANSASDAANITIAGGEVELGTWNLNAKTFTPTVTRPNAIRVTARRDGAANGPISTFFAGIVGVNSMNVSATAVAALGTAGGPTPPGALNAPFGISEDWFNGVAQCGDAISFSPANDPAKGCAAWHQFEESTGAGNTPQYCQGGGSGGGGGTGGNAKMLDNIIECIEAGNYNPPPVTPYQTQYNFTGGEVASAFPELQSLFNSAKEYNSQTNRDEWQVQIPVYQANGCSNTTGSVTIVGYANAAVWEVKTAPSKTIKADLQCNTFFDGAPPTAPGGGGGPATPLSPYPRLVS
ncbi:MAG: pilus assembly protein TadG-related protein [Nitrospirota bacterium]|nr:pilus assembly protein TadG-related protein [Nitrospirota bacterium]